MIKRIRVVPSVSGLAHFPKLKSGYWLKPFGTDKRHWSGILSPLNMRVIQDGMKHPQVWHQHHWNVPIDEAKKKI